MVEQHKDYTSYDKLAGRPLLDGSRLRVTFPDGTVEDVAVVTTERSGVTGACFDQWSDSTAYGVVTYRGARALVPLRGLEAAWL